MKLYLEGHNVKHGHAVSLQFSDAEISAMPPETVLLEPDEPVRFYGNRRHADRVIGRFNRRFATH
jgi:hypothetical protein